MSVEGTTLYCGDNCNHTGPHRYPPAQVRDMLSNQFDFIVVAEGHKSSEGDGQTAADLQEEEAE